MSAWRNTPNMCPRLMPVCCFHCHELRKAMRRRPNGPACSRRLIKGFSIMRWRMPSTAVVTRTFCGSATFR
ncbi:hypothetical protein D3C81_1627000 [compost metagenome]